MAARSPRPLTELLDGELDPAAIANDPVLASLAERIYGLDRKQIASMDEELEAQEDIDEPPAAPTEQEVDLLVDYVEVEPESEAESEPVAISSAGLPLSPGPAAPVSAPVPVAAGPAAQLATVPLGPSGPVRLIGWMGIIIGVIGLALALYNVTAGLGATGIGPLDGAVVGQEERDRLNWLSLGEIGNDRGWSLTSELGKPDIGMLSGMFLLTVIGFILARAPKAARQAKRAQASHA